MADQSSPTEVFMVDFATLAREIAMDIFPVEQIIELHRLTDEEWTRLQSHPKFIEMVRTLSAEWGSAVNTRERVKVKAATGLESKLEVYIRSIDDEQIPLAQRVEAGKFLARLGELDGQGHILGGGGSGVTINISTGGEVPPLTIEATSNPLRSLERAGVLPDEDESFSR
jgi:hypothetical protein